MKGIRAIRFNRSIKEKNVFIFLWHEFKFLCVFVVLEIGEKRVFSILSNSGHFGKGSR